MLPWPLFFLKHYAGSASTLQAAETSPHVAGVLVQVKGAGLRRIDALTAAFQSKDVGLVRVEAQFTAGAVEAVLEIGAHFVTLAT